MNEELKLRGYVTPEDFEGNDTERCQKALDTSEKEDIGKVVFTGKYALTEALKVPSMTEVVLKEGAELSGETVFENRVSGDAEKASWSFEDKFIYIKGEEGAAVKGDICFYHARNVVLEHLTVEGQVTFEFCREVRMEYDTVISGKCCAVKLIRGANNFIVQYNRFSAKKSGIRVSSTCEKGAYVMGKDVDNHELIFKDNEITAPAGFLFTAGEEAGIFNVQIDHNTVKETGIVIGEAEKALPKERFFNITATDFIGAVKAVEALNETKHCYFGE